jgi:RNA-directed DNA polymerase
MPTSLPGIAKKARSDKKHRFRDLYRMINGPMLYRCWQRIRKNAAYGVDKVSAADYEKHLFANIRQLVERLKQKRYRARLIRRHYIPKGNGKMRPLGIPVVEDKLLQLAVVEILGAIYEQDFLRCSYGYRPKVGALDAVDKLTIKLQFGRYRRVVEADIQGYFDNIDHDRLLTMLEKRIEDKALLQLIRKWLKAGVLETNGEVIHPEAGTPQGGIVSPMLANIYLHYCLDEWFQHVVKKHCRGEACLIRYADDFVCAFEREGDAERLYQVLGKRLEKFGLELSAEKTRVIAFGRGQSGQKSFEFLGFEFRWGKDRQGKAHIKRRTSRKKLRNSLARFTEWCREKRHSRVEEWLNELKPKLQGYYNYYGVSGNFARLQQFFREAMQILRKWLNRRSQRGSYTWEGFRALLDHFQVPQPRIRPRPRIRLAASAR